MSDQPGNTARGEQSTYVETEAKFEVTADEMERVKAELIAFGARCIATRQAEDNELFDFADGRLRVAGCALRLRIYGDNHILTFKGPVKPDPKLKKREELETAVSNGSVMRYVLLQLGLRVSFRYSKFREVFNLDWSGAPLQVCLDETPVGLFVEIEGPAEAIHTLASHFGFTQYITQSYIELYTQRLRGR